MIDLIVGLVLLALGACGLIAWWHDFGEFLRGVIPLVFVLIGLAAIGAGLKKSRQRAEHEVESEGEALHEPGADMAPAGRKE